MIKKMDINGKEISSEEYDILFEDIDYCSLGDTCFTDGTRISTVWLGVDLIRTAVDNVSRVSFETAFINVEGHVETVLKKYWTKEEALQGHNEFVSERVNTGVKAI